MNKKIIIIVGMLVIFLSIIMMSLYLIVQKYDNTVRSEYFREDAYLYLSENDEFITKYGSILTFEAVETKIHDNKKDNDHIYPYVFMRFYCNTEKAELVVYIEHIFVENSNVYDWTTWQYVVENEIWQ